MNVSHLLAKDLTGVGISRSESSKKMIISQII